MEGEKKTTFFFTQNIHRQLYVRHCLLTGEREKKHGSSGEPALLLAVRDKGGAFAISAAAAPPHVNSIVDERDSVRVLSIRADEATTLPTLAEP